MEETKEKLTRTQQNSLHEWCEQIAEAYAEKGLTLNDIISKFTIELYPTKESVKEIIIKTIIDKMFGKRSTTELLKSGEIDKLIDVVTLFNSKAGIETPPFPDKDNEAKEVGEKLKDL